MSVDGEMQMSANSVSVSTSISPNLPRAGPDGPAQPSDPALVATGEVASWAIARRDLSVLPLLRRTRSQRIPGLPQGEDENACGCGWKTWARAFAAMGVIFGDIGTSPLYSYNSVYCNSPGPACLVPQAKDVKGVLSITIWSVILITSIKYIIFLLFLDHNGEGGIFALQMVIQQNAKRPISNTMRKVLLVAAVFGSSALIGDAVITPAISVVSAVQGFEDPHILTPNTPGSVVSSVTNNVPIIACGFLWLLFLWQPWGTQKVGLLYSPVMFLYFISIGGVGLYNIIATGNYEVLEGLSPSYAFELWITGQYAGLTAFTMMSSILLSLTGSEAVYADSGHFGRKPIQLAWFGFVFPMLILTYAGQGAYMISYPESAATVFFACLPGPLYIPILILSILATIVASQAMITGCFSLISQAVALGLLPRVRIYNTDPDLHGQVYIPAVNWTLAICVTAFILGFQSSIALSNAYGMTVVIAFNLTTFLIVNYLYYVQWPNYPVALPILVMSPLIFLEGLYFTSALYTKFVNGAWAPFLIAAVLSSGMLLWRFGQIETLREIVHQQTPSSEPHSDAKSGSGRGDSVAPFSELGLRTLPQLSAAVSSGGGILAAGHVAQAAIFFCADEHCISAQPADDSAASDEKIPLVLSRFLNVTLSLPQVVVLLSVQFHQSAPTINEAHRITFTELLAYDEADRDEPTDAASAPSNGEHADGDQLRRPKLCCYMCSARLHFGYAEPLDAMSIDRIVAEVVLRQIPAKFMQPRVRLASGVPPAPKTPGRIVSIPVSVSPIQYEPSSAATSLPDEASPAAAASSASPSPPPPLPLFYFLLKDDVEPDPARPLVRRLAVTLYGLLLAVSVSDVSFYRLPQRNVVQLGDVLLI